MRGLTVLPAGDARGRPLLVFLHGRGNDEDSYLHGPLFGALKALGRRAPIAAFPGGADDKYWQDRASGAWGTYVFREVIPHVVRRFGADRRRVAIGGISMGGDRRRPESCVLTNAGTNLERVPFETALDQWDAGLRRLAAAGADEQPVLERVTRRVEAELRRRLGGPFTTQELVDLYDAGTGWVSDVAVDAAPEDPAAWDVRVVGDAAFGRYVREASDYAGGRRINPADA